MQSSIVEDSIQIDGRRYIRELHIDDVGIQHTRMFLAPANYDRNAGLAENAAILQQQLIDAELTENLAEIDNAEI